MPKDLTERQLQLIEELVFLYMPICKSTARQLKKRGANISVLLHMFHANTMSCS
jgi:hypothetical protein